MVEVRDLKYRFGRRLKALRKALGLTQSGLAEWTEISEEYLSKIERGLASPSFRVIESLAQHLGVRLEDLFAFGDESVARTRVVERLMAVEALLGSVFDTIPFGTFISTDTGHFKLVSRSLAAMLGYDSVEEMQSTVHDIAYDLYETPEERTRLLAKVPPTGSTSLTTKLRCKPGTYLPVRLHMRRVRPHAGRKLGVHYLGIVENLLPVDRAATDLQWVPPILERELHHRIKNNFSLLKAYVDLQAARKENAPCCELLTRIGTKLLAAAQVHERIYGGDGHRHLDVSSYLQSILEPVRTGFAEPLGIGMQLDCDEYTLDWQKILPLGIITVELVTNAIRHAYPEPGVKVEGEDCVGNVRVSTRCAGGRCNLEVSDDGIGLRTDLASSDGLGLKLVESLVQQLDGHLDVASGPDSGPGSAFRVDFPAN